MTLENEMALEEKIHLITKYQKAYISNSLKIMAQKSPLNVKVICDYIIAEQNEFNIKESTKEGKIKCLIWLSSLNNSNLLVKQGDIGTTKIIVLVDSQHSLVMDTKETEGDNLKTIIKNAVYSNSSTTLMTLSVLFEKMWT